MATSTLQGQTAGTESIIAGYFPTGDDAHRAINALLDEGFLPEQIGAAFHTGSGTSSETKTEPVLGGETMRAELGTTVTSYHGSDNTVAGAASDDSAVQPAGLATGSGSTFVGVGKPGPISGSSLAHTGLPSELVHELPNTAPVSSAASSGYAPESASTTHLVSAQHHLHPAKDTKDTSWGTKLKHLFQSKHESHETSTKTSEGQSFGTGEGTLGVAPPYGHPYSPAEFERTVSGVGVAPEHSQHISRRLSSGGAVVTVQSSGRAAEVEQIFERHNGHVRFASSTFDDAPPYSGADSRVEVFGHLEPIYPNYNR